MKKSTIWIIVSIISALIIPIILIVGFFAYMFYSFEKSIASVTDIERYPKILSQWREKNPESVSHFPNEIPLDVKNTRFCFVPPFLQGDGHIELSFQTSPEKIQVYYDKFKKIETYSQQDYSSSFYTSKDDEIRWDVKKDLERMYFQPDPQNTQEHEPEYGVAINKNENTIIFWAQW